jgi:thiol:disulfide interchange protein DsbD
MLTFSLGLNTLLLVIGFSAGALKALPKSGRWMVIIKKIMAFLLLTGGLYFIFKAGQLS